MLDKLRDNIHMSIIDYDILLIIANYYLQTNHFTILEKNLISSS